MKKITNQFNVSHVGRMNYGGGKVPKDRPVPIDVVDVVASAYTYGGADYKRRTCNVHSLRG